MPVFDCVIGDVVRSVTVCTIPGQISTNSRDYQIVQLTGASVMPSSVILQAFFDTWNQEFKDCLSNDATFYGIMLYKRTPVGLAPRPDHTGDVAGPGTAGAGLLPPQTSGLISFYSAVLGKTGQGRMYVPFPSLASGQADGTATAAYTTALNNLGTVMIQNVVAANGPVQAILRPVLYKPGGDPPRFLISQTPHDGFATQRKRGAYGKTNTPPF